MGYQVAEGEPDIVRWIPRSHPLMSKPAVDVRCVRCREQRQWISPPPMMGRVLDGLQTVYTLTRVGVESTEDVVDGTAGGLSRRVHGPDLESTTTVKNENAWGYVSHDVVLRKGGQLRCRVCSWTPRLSHAAVVDQAIRDFGDREYRWDEPCQMYV